VLGLGISGVFGNPGVFGVEGAGIPGVGILGAGTAGNSGVFGFKIPGVFGVEGLFRPGVVPGAGVGE
jgi:hypothetical protein